MHFIKLDKNQRLLPLIFIEIEEFSLSTFRPIDRVGGGG